MDWSVIGLRVVLIQKDGERQEYAIAYTSSSNNNKKKINIFLVKDHQSLK